MVKSPGLTIQDSKLFNENLSIIFKKLFMIELIMAKS